MGAVKIKAADSWFSKCVRMRSGWKCERCGAQHDRSSTGLHCSHFHGRGNWSVRFDPDNAEALCYGCHSLMGANPSDHEQRIREKLGEARYEILLEKKNNTSLGRQAKREQKEISKFYRVCFSVMEKQRLDGFEGYLEFGGYF